MRVVFFGTPDVAAVALEALIRSAHQVVAVVTQPDRPKGRSGAPQPPPAKHVATAAGIPVLQPPSPKDQGFAQSLAQFAPDACAVVAYGHLLPTAVLAVPPRGTYNAHFSLLPRYRGAAPVQRAIMNGDRLTGVCVFGLEPTLDTGPILERVEVAINDDDTTGTLLARLAPVGAAALIRTLDAVESGTAQPQPQDDAAATPAPKIKPHEARIDWTQPAATIRNRIRGLNPSPGAYTTFRGKRLKVWAADLDARAGAPGTVVDPAGLVVATEDAALRLTDVQPEGKRRMSGEQFANGSRLSSGEPLGEHPDNPS